MLTKKCFSTLVLFFSFIIFISPLENVNAHSSLMKTAPRGGEELKNPPRSIEVWFQDPVTVHSKSIEIVNERGERFYSEKAKNDQNDKGYIKANLKKELSPGNYTVKINVLAPDGEVVKETFSFKVLQEGAELSGEGLNLVKASPGDGEITTGSIQQFELWFNQPVNVSMIGLFDDKKQPVPIKEAMIDSDDPTHVIVESYEDLSAGTYQVSWFAKPLGIQQVYDSMGVYYFAVKKFTPMNPPEGNQNVNWIKNMGLKQVSYWLFFIGLVSLFGLTFFNKMIASIHKQKRWNIIVNGLSILTIVGFLLLIVELYKDIGDLPFLEFLKLKFIFVPIVQIVMITLGIFFERYRIWLYAVALFMTPFVVGHASIPRYGGWLTIFLNELHLFAVAIWSGGLLALIIFAPKHHSRDWLKASAYHFSKWAFSSVMIIAVTGIWLATQYIPSFSLESLLRSAFGRALLIKSGLFFIVILVAFFVRRTLSNLSDKLVKGFIFKLRTELLYGIAILFFASNLVVSTPSAAEQGIYPERIVEDGIELQVGISPLFPGYSVINLDFDSREIENVTVTLSMPPDWQKTNEAFKVAEGKFKVTGMLLHSGGTVEMIIRAVKKNGEAVIYPVKVVVPGEFRLNE